MKHSITVGAGDTFAYTEDWGYPTGVTVGDLTIHFTDDDAIQSLHGALYALEMELASRRDKTRRELSEAVENSDFSAFMHDTEGHAA